MAATTFEGRPVTVLAAKGSRTDKVYSTAMKQIYKMYDLDSDLLNVLNSFDLSTREGQVDFVKTFEKFYVELMSKHTMPKFDNITKTVFGKEDGLPCEVTVIAPVDQKGPLPGIVNLHGGAMAFSDGKGSEMYGSEKMVSDGKAVCCVVHFTNSTEEAFPRGFNDCVAAIRWFHERQEKFNLIRGAGVLVSGGSGGGNLAAASCLKLKGEGVIACCVLECPIMKPIANLKEFEKYTEDEINAMHLFFPKQEFAPKLEAACVELYTSSEEDRKNVLAWPGLATNEDVKGLPPTLFLLDEADKLTAQALEYYRKLDRNGVTASAVTFAGSAHGMYAVDPLHYEIAEAYFVALTRTHCKPKEALQKEKESEEKEQN